MSRPLRIQYPDAYYHVTCRGNEQRAIFLSSGDQQDFFRILTRSLEIFSVRLLAYALMSNHFHLLVCTPKGNLSEFMRHFNISYTGTFNRKYKRSGHLYQGRYKAFLIDRNNYLLEVSRYVHLNPLRMKSRAPLEQRWRDLLTSDATSLPGYLDVKNHEAFIHYETILRYFGPEDRKSRDEYRQFVAEGVGKDISSPLEKGKGTGIVGEEDFIKEVKERLGRDRKNSKSLREQPELRELGQIMTSGELIDRYARLVRMPRGELAAKGTQSIERAMLMELLYRFCHITQPEIGRLLGGIDYSAVSQARKRFQLKMQHDPELAERFREIQDNMDQMSRIKI